MTESQIISNIENFVASGNFEQRTEDKRKKYMNAITGEIDFNVKLTQVRCST